MTDESISNELVKLREECTFRMSEDACKLRLYLSNHSAISGYIRSYPARVFEQLMSFATGGPRGECFSDGEIGCLEKIKASIADEGVSARDKERLVIQGLRMEKVFLMLGAGLHGNIHIRIAHAHPESGFQFMFGGTWMDHLIVGFMSKDMDSIVRNASELYQEEGHTIGIPYEEEQCYRDALTRNVDVFKIFTDDDTQEENMRKCDEVYNMVTRNADFEVFPVNELFMLGGFFDPTYLERDIVDPLIAFILNFRFHESAPRAQYGTTAEYTQALIEKINKIDKACGGFNTQMVHDCSVMKNSFDELGISETDRLKCLAIIMYLVEHGFGGMKRRIFNAAKPLCAKLKEVFEKERRFYIDSDFADTATRKRREKLECMLEDLHNGLGCSEDVMVDYVYFAYEESEMGINLECIEDDRFEGLFNVLYMLVSLFEEMEKDDDYSILMTLCGIPNDVGDNTCIPNLGYSIFIKKEENLTKRD